MEGRHSLITGENALRVLNVTQLKANLFDYETKKQERSTKPKRVKKQIIDDNPF